MDMATENRQEAIFLNYRSVELSLILMAKKKNDFWNGLLTMGGILGLGWVMVEAIKLASTEEYRCPNCKGKLIHNQPECPTCHATLTWKV